MIRQRHIIIDYICGFICLIVCGWVFISIIEQPCSKKQPFIEVSKNDGIEVGNTFIVTRVILDTTGQVDTISLNYFTPIK